MYAAQRGREDGPVELVLRGARLGVEGPLVDLTVGSGLILDIAPTGATEPAADVVELDGSTVLPGLWDAHVHSRQWALQQHGVDLSDVPTAAAAAERVVGALPGVPMVVAYRADPARWSAHKDLLAAEDRPVLVQSADLHIAWLNDRALELAGRRGHPTGVLYEADCFDAVAVLCSQPELRADAWVLETMTAAAARGVVGIVDFEMADNLADWTRRSALTSLPVRVDCTIPRYLADEAMSSGLRTGETRAERVRVGPVKLFLDGSFNSGTAALSPADAPLIAPDDLDRLVKTLAGHGLECAIHAIGDYAVTLALDTLERAGSPGRIEHVQLVRAKDLPRFGALGVVASIQPAHLLADRDLELWSTHGTTGGFAYRSLLSAGAPLALGSDAPVTPLDPWIGIAAAVRRTTGDRPPWTPDQRLSLLEALAASTGGRLAPGVGDPADLVVVGPTFGAGSGAETDLADTPVHATMLGGTWTHGG